MPLIQKSLHVLRMNSMTTTLPETDNRLAYSNIANSKDGKLPFLLLSVKMF